MAMAETITTLDTTGCIASHEVLGKREIPEYVDEAETENVSIPIADKETDSADSKSAAHLEDDLRKGGDWAIYAYYFAKAGRLSTIVFFILQLVFGFLSTFPSKSAKSSSYRIVN